MAPEEAGVVPGLRDLLHAIRADPGHHLHWIAPGYLCHTSFLLDDVASPYHLQQTVGVVCPGNGPQADMGHLLPALDYLVLHLVDLLCRFIEDLI